MLQSIERYMKEAIVDREPSVSSAALTCSLVGRLHCCYIHCLIDLHSHECCCCVSVMLYKSVTVYTVSQKTPLQSI